MKKLIKTIIIIAAIACSTTVYGHHYRHGYGHHYSGWGHGGRYFWPGFAGGHAGSLLWRPLPPPPPPVVVPTPVIVPPAPVVVSAPAPVYVPQHTVIVR